MWSFHRLISYLWEGLCPFFFPCYNFTLINKIEFSRFARQSKLNDKKLLLLVLTTLPSFSPGHLLAKVKYCAPVVWTPCFLKYDREECLSNGKMILLLCSRKKNYKQQHRITKEQGQHLMTQMEIFQFTSIGFNQTSISLFPSFV